MTDEQKKRKLSELERLIDAAENTSAPFPSDLVQSAALELDDARQLASNLRRQLAGEAPPHRKYHRSFRPKTS